jgi:hypothetical protein
MMGKMNFFIIPVLIVVTLIIGFLIGTDLKNKTVVSPPSSEQNWEAAFFDSRIGSVSGKVINVKEKTITIENNKKQSRDFEAADKVFILTNSEKGPASPSSDLRQIEIGKNAYISFNMEGAIYKIHSITYMPNTPPLPLTSNIKK